MQKHDPQGYALSLSAKLATRSRHVCVLLGAGASRACDLPDVTALQAKVLEDLSASDKEDFNRLLEGRNIEEALSRLRRIAALVSGDETVDKLTAPRAIELDTSVCRAIVRVLDIHNANIAPISDFAAWVARSNYRLPIEIFTVNYDLLIETALERFEVPYFDGFVGNLKARFRTDLVEAIPELDNESVPSLFVRLWKLHGSVNWIKDDGNIVRIGQPAPEDIAAAIYPSDTKYEESRRMPFIVLQDRLRRALHHPETLILISGYSFGDEHLNELIFDAATRRERSEFVVFCYSDIPAGVAERANRTPNLQVVNSNEAVLGGLRAEWKSLPEPIQNLWEDDKFLLNDFRHLAAYLARSVTRDAGSQEIDITPSQPAQTEGNTSE